MDALEALGHDGFHAEKVGALGGPVTARAGAVFLAGKDDERNSVSFIGHAGVVDKRRLSTLALISLSGAGTSISLK